MLLITRYKTVGAAIMGTFEDVIIRGVVADYIDMGGRQDNIRNTAHFLDDLCCIIGCIADFLPQRMRELVEQNLGG